MEPQVIYMTKEELLEQQQLELKEKVLQMAWQLYCTFDYVAEENQKAVALKCINEAKQFIKTFEEMKEK